MLDAGSPVSARTLTVTSTTPGYTAIIRTGASASGPFSDDSSSQVAGAATTFRLDGKQARYYLIWITGLGNQEAVRINEVKAG